MDFSIFGLKYARLITAQISFEEIENLKKQYSYFHIVSFQKPSFFARVKVIPKKTLLIDLSQPLEAVFQGFNKTTRNEIRKTKQPEYQSLIFSIPDSDFEKSYQLYYQVKRYDDKVVPEPRQEFNYCKFFNAYLNNKLIASIACYDTGQMLRFKSIVSRRKEAGFEGRVMAYVSRRLVWEICQYAKKKNYQLIDLGNVNFKEPAKAGITRFKQGFGGRIVDIYILKYQKPIFKIVRSLLRFCKIDIF